MQSTHAGFQGCGPIVGPLMLALLLAAGLAIPLRAGQSAKSDAPMTNKDVTQMIAIGLSEGVVIASIHAARATNFDISVDALKALKDQHVPDGVIQVMIETTGNNRASGEAAAAAPDLNNPAAAHDAGVWIVIGGQMKQIDGAVLNDTKMGVSMLPGAKSHSSAALSHPHATVQLEDTNPVFYMYFDKRGEAANFASMMDPTPTAPGQYQLVRLEVKKDQRVMVTGTYGGFGGMHQGPNKKDLVDFASTKIGSGIYKITLSKPLEPGEYCFSPASSSGLMAMPGATVYDFGVGGK